MRDEQEVQIVRVFRLRGYRSVHPHGDRDIRGVYEGAVTQRAPAEQRAVCRQGDGVINAAVERSDDPPGERMVQRAVSVRRQRRSNR